MAVYDLLVGSVMRDEDLTSLGAMLEQMGAAADDGRLVDAARTSHHHSATDDEFAALEAYLDGEYFERCAGIVPAALQWVRQGAAYEGPRSTDPEMLAQIAAPVLVLRAQKTPPWLGRVLADSEEHVAQHVPYLHVREPLSGLGHYAPLLAPEPIAKGLISFFESVR